MIKFSIETAPVKAAVNNSLVTQCAEQLAYRHMTFGKAARHVLWNVLTHDITLA
jgi:hypothetical protein